MPVLDSTGSASCPPHHWFIQAYHKPLGSTESWTCLRCNFVRTVERQREQAVPRRIFRVGPSSGQAAAAPATDRDSAIAEPVAVPAEGPGIAARGIEEVIVRT